MNVHLAALQMMKNEARALLSRVNLIESFAMHTPMVAAAAIPLSAQVAIEQHLMARRQKLRSMVRNYIRWLDSPEGLKADPSLAQRKFSILRLRFIAVLSQLHIFADVLNQRSEHGTGVWLSGLDVFAADALELPGGYYQSPPVICYLERGPGAAIRRARTRLPGGDSNPVAVIQVPRERMIGSGIASSLVHEVGHQGAALLDLIHSLRPVLAKAISQAGPEKGAWVCWERWISEIVADFWAVAKLGVAATTGLMIVVSLPRAFVFRVDMEDPHPAPWVRVMLSCALGQALYPHPQWPGLARMWESFYPLTGLAEDKRKIFILLGQSLPRFVNLLINHRPMALKGISLKEAVTSADRRPETLAAHYRSWRKSPELMRQAAPSLVFSVIGQAKVDGTITPAEESQIVGDLLKHWALKITLDTSAICSTIPTEQRFAAAV
jgi:hypothetical protein